jgi:hypothetical protein
VLSRRLVSESRRYLASDPGFAGCVPGSEGISAQELREASLANIIHPEKRRGWAFN